MAPMKIFSFLGGFVLSLVCTGAVLAAGNETGGYTFVVDGEPLEPRAVVKAGKTAPLIPGDVIYIRGQTLCVDEPGHYEFKVENDIVFRVLAGGKLLPVSCAITPQYDKSLPLEVRYKATPKILNPLSQWGDVELKALRGVTVNAWSDEIEKQLAKLDLERVCLRLERGAMQERLAPVPADLRTLVVDPSGPWSCEDMSGFKRLKKLKYLDLSRASPESFDFAVLKDLPLEFLALPMTQTVRNAEVLGSFGQLKTLSGNYTSYFGDGRWLTNLESLETLEASHLFLTFSNDRPEPLDLAALAGLGRLKAVHAQSSPVKSLPSTPMPALKELSLMLSGVPQESLDAFAKANPQTRIRHSLNTELAERLGKADRVRARTGGVCNRDEDKEELIYESRDREEIAELARHMVVEEAQSGGYCMCCGNPSFEFYEGDKQVVMIGFHHGRSIRWADGTWPGDGMLAGQSAGFLVEWLARKGYGGPKDELLAERRQAQAQKRQMDRFNAILPSAVIEGLKKAGAGGTGEGEILPPVASDEERAQKEWANITAPFEANIKDVRERARVFLRILGWEECTWRLYSGLDTPVVEAGLPGIPKDTLRAAILAAPIPSEEALGGVRWIFGEERAADFQQPQEAFQRLVQFALAHPRQANRWQTLKVLRDLDTPETRAVLRMVMKKGTTPRSLSEEEAVEPPGDMIFRPGTISLPEDTPDSAAAALCLALLDDEETRAEVKGIRNALPEASRKAWDEALSRK